MATGSPLRTAIGKPQVLYEHVIRPSEHYSAGGAELKIKGGYPNYGDLSSKLPSWMIRQDLAAYPMKRLSEAGFSRESYASPHAAVWHYLAALTVRGEAVVWSRDDECFCVRPDLQNLLHRRVEMEWRVTKLLVAAQVEDVEAEYGRWANGYRADGLTPFELIEAGGEGYRTLSARIGALEKMVSHHPPTVVDDLCGLPLEAVRQRQKEAIAAAEAKRLEALEKAATDRQQSIRADAVRSLEGDATGWLAQTVAGTTTCFLDYARESDEALRRLEHKLARDSDARRKRIADERQTAELRSQLVKAARQAFPSEEHAQLFLNSGQARLGGGRPIDHCRSQADFP